MLMLFRWSVATTISVVAVGAPAHATEARYQCAGGTRVVAQFSPPDAAKGQVALSFEGSGSKTILAQARSADGGRYAGDGIEFWIKGRTARLTRGSVSETCATD